MMGIPLALSLSFALHALNVLVLGAVLPRQDATDGPVIFESPNNKCGPQTDGVIYSCSKKLPCCTSNGYCVESDDFCLIESLCHPDYSADLGWSCYGPNRAKRVSAEPQRAACGTSPTGDLLGICPYDGNRKCCSKAGTCGEDSIHCSISFGCQAGYGICWDEASGSGPQVDTPVSNPPSHYTPPVNSTDDSSDDDNDSPGTKDSGGPGWSDDGPPGWDSD